MTKASLARELGVVARTITRWEFIALSEIDDYLNSKTVGGKIKLKTPLLPYHQFCLREIGRLMKQLQDAELVSIVIRNNIERFLFRNFTNTMRTVNNG